MVVALSLAAALIYGAADFLGGLASRRASSVAVVVWSQATGLVVLALALVVVPGTLRTSDLGWGALCGVCGAFAVALLYRALAIGIMGIVSPITAALAAAIPVTWALLRGEHPAPLALAGIGWALVAVVLVSATPSPPKEEVPLARPDATYRYPPGLAEALGAGAAFGFFFIALAQTAPTAGLWPLVATRLCSLTILLAGGLIVRAPLRISRPGWRVVFACGTLDMLANVLYVVAAHRGSLSIVAVLTSLYPAGTVALAALVLHERLIPLQWLGVVAALAGVICISLAR